MNYEGFYSGLTRGINDTWNRINNLCVIDFDLNFHYGEPKYLYDTEECIEMVSYHELRQFQT